MAKRVAKKKAKKKVTKLISDWAVEQYDQPDKMCEAGRAVYDAIVKLEAKGKTPAQIIAFFQKSNEIALEFVYDRVGWPGDQDNSELYSAQEDIRQDLSADYDVYSDEYAAAVAAFNKAADAEYNRLEDLLNQEQVLTFENGEFTYKREE